MCTILKAWKAGSNFLGTHKKSISSSSSSSKTLSSLARERLASSIIYLFFILIDWIWHSDGKLSFLGFVRLLHGVPHEHFRRLETTNYSD
ncbi:unnamed protein product [Coffea canephora]|uniref:DH200=94 genomic scaffold, scaffold_12241 n=1 Tax=Coffea canephora TaxID=49390 RepID=A0A068VNR0_COFCA|nr:unnamed protein product [Coffea canephora]